MTSPMLTVVVLTVLWLIVVVPMVLRRKDAGAGERSVSRFGASMRALASRRAVSLGSAVPVDAADREPEVHVSGGNRTPVPASKEALMYPPDRHEMSDARRAMLARRRRSLTGLGAGTAVFLLLGIFLGGLPLWCGFAVFAVGLTGYLFFLRSQAQRDRDRRESRLRRAAVAPAAGYEATEPRPARVVPDNAVRIDDDDVHLDHIDTVDLTGLYREAEPEGGVRVVAAGRLKPTARTDTTDTSEGGTDEQVRRAG
jgi:hypothetical protein